MSWNSGSRFMDVWAPLAAFCAYVQGACDTALHQGHKLQQVSLPRALGAGRPTKERERALRQALTEANARLFEARQLLVTFSGLAQRSGPNDG